MAKKRLSKKHNKNNDKINDKVNITSSHASLCALAPVIRDKNVFEPIHTNVNIPQKKITPTGKLVFLTLGIMSGIQTVYDVNYTFRKVCRIVFNPSFPLINLIIIAFRALLKPYGITVSLDEI